MTYVGLLPESLDPRASLRREAERERGPFAAGARGQVVEVDPKTLRKYTRVPTPF